MSPHVPRLRMSLLGVVVVSLFVVLGMRLYDLQIVGSYEYEVQAEANRTRRVVVPAPRGRILDRNGKVVVDNHVTSVVAVDRTEFRRLRKDERQDLLNRLSHELSLDGREVTPDQITSRLSDQRFSPYVPVPVATGVSEALRIYLAERSEDFPAVRAERTTLREYPYGRLGSNLLGYVGAINEGELEEHEGEKAKPYSLNDRIGKAGVELSYEEHLRGTPGIRDIEVDAEGNPVRVIDEVLPQSGSDLYLTIDIDLQAMAQQRLEQGLEEARQRPGRGVPNEGTRGAVVVEDPNNGDILAMASYPTYDPRDFINGISQEQWEYLMDPANQYPLNNWAIQGTWAPGSTYKMFTAYAALSSGLITGDTVINDGGSYYCGSGCSISNFGGGSAMGPLTLPVALQRSSNVFFATLGGRFWDQREQFGSDEAMQEHMKALGLGQLSGIPLAYEEEGRVPSAPWIQDYCADKGPTCDSYWAAGHNARTAIGQGDVLVTPLQMANGYSMMANGGTRYQPQIVDRIEPPTGEPFEVEAEVKSTAPMPEHVRGPILDGLTSVTRAGTASGAFAGFPLDEFLVAGKTGTGERPGRADTAAFMSFGPLPNPQYAISVILEESGTGGTAAAPVARALYDALAGVEPMPPAPVDGNLPPPDDDLIIPESGVFD